MSTSLISIHHLTSKKAKGVPRATGQNAGTYELKSSYFTLYPLCHFSGCLQVHEWNPGPGNNFTQIIRPSRTNHITLLSQ